MASVNTWERIERQKLRIKVRPGSVTVCVPAGRRG